MKPKIFEKMVQHSDTSEPVVLGNIPMYVDTTGTRIHDSELSVDDVAYVTKLGKSISSHLSNKDIHVTLADKSKWNDYYEEFMAHTLDDTIHITEADKTNWDNKETTEGAQVKANIVQSNLNEHINDDSVHCTAADRQTWFDKYTKAEIDNKFSMMEFNNDWKEAVQTFDDLFTVYPDPYEGWTVNVLDTGITYRFDGDEWVGISANATPLATHEIDGLMSKDDKIKLDGIEEGANNYYHPETNDNGDEIFHVTQEQMDYWSSKADQVLVSYLRDGLMGKEDKYKLDGIEEGATNYVEPDYFLPSKIQQDEDNRFVTDEEKTYWSNKANSNLASENLDGLMSKSDKHKLDSIEFNANYYVHPTYHYPSMIRQDEDNRFVTDEQISYWNAKSDSAPATSESAGIMSAEDKAKLDGIEEEANNYIHPEFHEPDIILQDKDNRFVSDLDIANWNGKKNQDEIVCGSGIINSTEGAVILHTMGGTNYACNVTFTQEPTNVGEVWVEKYNDSCVVKCSGTARDVEFDYILIKYYK